MLSSYSNNASYWLLASFKQLEYFNDKFLRKWPITLILDTGFPFNPRIKFFLQKLLLHPSKKSMHCNPGKIFQDSRFKIQFLSSQNRTHKIFTINYNQNYDQNYKYNRNKRTWIIMGIRHEVFLLRFLLAKMLFITFVTYRDRICGPHAVIIINLANIHISCTGNIEL